MDRPTYLILTSTREDETDWLNEMADNGWLLISVNHGTYYFEHIEVVVGRTIEALDHDFKANGLFRDLIDKALSEAISGVGR